MDENEEPGPEVRVPVAPRLPKQPTAEEVMRHRITHLPFAAWCADCVSARAKDDPHTRQAPTHVPTVQVDYSFLGTAEATDKTATLVIANLVGVGYGFADIVECKGTMDTVLGRNFTTWLKEIGHGSGDVIIQSDPEPAIKIVAEAFGKLRRQLDPGSKVLVRTSPRKSSNSQGAVERFAQSISGMARTLALAVERQWKQKLQASSPIFPWLVRHGEFLHNRCQTRASGLTPWEAIYHRPFKSPMFPFTSPVLMRIPGCEKSGALPKLERRWIPGLWLGRQHASGEHIIAMRDGVQLHVASLQAMCRE